MDIWFGTCENDFTVTHQEIFSIAAAGVTEISHDFLVQIHSESQTVNVSNDPKVLKILQSAFDHVYHDYLLQYLNSWRETEIQKLKSFSSYILKVVKTVDVLK